MKIPYYQVDVFTNTRFRGNPAGVCLLPGDWLDTALMQNIAAENNLSETAFVVQKGDLFELRWFTPQLEMDLCGHATVAPAHVLFKEIGYGAHEIVFNTPSGEVAVSRSGDQLILDFPSREPLTCDAPADLDAVMGSMPQQVLRSRDLLLVYENESRVRAIAPDFRAMAQWDCLGVIVTSPGDEADFVSRFFAPKAGVNEDPVTGSAHCTLIPYWADKLGKDRLHALQVSRRGGELFCRYAGQRVKIGGNALTYLRGELEV